LLGYPLTFFHVRGFALQPCQVVVMRGNICKNIIPILLTTLAKLEGVGDFHV